MKINSINYMTNNKSNVQSFKRTAIPYPEYRAAYMVSEQDGFLFALKEKINKLFNPEVAEEAKEIKSKIDKLYEGEVSDPKKQLLSIFA